MDASGAGITVGNAAQQQSAKRNFFQWAIKWFYANMADDNHEKPDVSLLATLLQSIGFQLRGFEKSEEALKTDGSQAKNDCIKIVVECGNSGMRACLELDGVKCQCPKPEATKEASFWSVSGTGPTNAATIESVNKIEESGSNLLPPISKDTAKMINDIVYHLFNTIGDKSSFDANQNSKSRSNLNLNRLGKSIEFNNQANKDSSNFVRSYTQPDIVFNLSPRIKFEPTDRSLNKKTNYGWGETYDAQRASLDSDQPRPSPPKIISSPNFVLDELCSSLGSISIQSEEDVGSIATHVIRAHKSLEKALEIIAARRSPINDQATFLKPAARGSSLKIGDSASRRSSNSTGSLKISPTGPNSRPSSSCSMPSRGFSATLSLPKNKNTSSKSPVTRRSVGSTMTKISTIPKSSTMISTNPTANKNPEQNASGASKIPGRRKSFHSLGPLKLAAVNAKHTASSVNTNPTSSTSSSDMLNTTQSAIPKFAPLKNQSTVIPTLKVAPLKTLGQKENKETARKSIGQPRFGYGNKKT